MNQLMNSWHGAGISPDLCFTATQANSINFFLHGTISVNKETSTNIIVITCVACSCMLVCMTWYLMIIEANCVLTGLLSCYKETIIGTFIIPLSLVNTAIGGFSAVAPALL